MRLIDADELIDDIRKKARAGFPENKNLSLYAESCVIHAIAVDAVPVVRCRDCKWYEDNGVCEWTSSYPIKNFRDEDDFCSDGERKDGDGNG